MYKDYRDQLNHEWDVYVITLRRYWKLMRNEPFDRAYYIIKLNVDIYDR